MDLNNIKEFLESNKENSEVIETLKGFVPKQEEEITLDKVQEFLNSKEEGKTLIQKEKDSHFSKGLETWKQNNLNKLIEDEISKRFPNETEEQKQIRELKRKIEETEAKSKQSELRILAKDIAKEKGLPFELVDYFLGGDEEGTKENLNKLENTFKKAVEEAVKKQLGEDGYNPSNPKTNEFTSEDVLKMTEAELTANWDKIKHLLK